MQRMRQDLLCVSEITSVIPTTSSGSMISGSSVLGYLGQGRLALEPQEQGAMEHEVLDEVAEADDEDEVDQVLLHHIPLLLTL
jgi:hypothetical protein